MTTFGADLGNVLFDFEDLRFYSLFEQNSDLWPNFRNSGSIFLCQHGTSHKTCYTCKLPENH